jgi:hypothetical protein
MNRKKDVKNDGSTESFRLSCSLGYVLLKNLCFAWTLAVAFSLLFFLRALHALALRQVDSP